MGFIVVDMNARPKSPSELRQQAEALNQKGTGAAGLEGLAPAETQKLLHELQVHQLELELQNEELRRAQAELEASQARYFDLYDLAPMGYLTLSEQGLIQQANLAAAKLLGRTRSELLQRPLARFLPKEDQDPYYLYLKQLLEAGAAPPCELRLLRRDGEPVWVQVVATPAQAADGSLLFRLVFSDLTAHKEAEAAQQALQAQLQQAQKMASLGTLAGGVAHDMNNVLGAILGLSSAHLELHPPGSPTHRAFETITKAATRGGKLVQSLLGFARKTPAENVLLDVNKILREEVRMLEHTTMARLAIKLDLAADLRPIRGDGSALTHAFMNLCVNAVHAMPEHGTLSLQTRNLDQDWLEVLVEDTGSGMAKEVLAKALDPFFTTKGVGQGTGLGLSMVHSTVTAHRGRMEIASEPGRGTRVRLCFPTCAPETQAAELPQATPAESGKPLSVLLVDDDELVSGSIEALLDLLGHTTTAVFSGEEALAQLAAGLEPEVVILDMNMPGLSGAETLPRLRALRPALPVLLATGRADQFARDLVAANPQVTLLPKPFTLVELREQLQAVVRAG